MRPSRLARRYVEISFARLVLAVLLVLARFLCASRFQFRLGHSLRRNRVDEIAVDSGLSRGLGVQGLEQVLRIGYRPQAEPTAGLLVAVALRCDKVGGERLRGRRRLRGANHAVLGGVESRRALNLKHELAFVFRRRLRGRPAGRGVTVGGCVPGIDGCPGPFRRPVFLFGGRALPLALRSPVGGQHRLAVGFDGRVGVGAGGLNALPSELLPYPIGDCGGGDVGCRFLVVAGNRCCG